MRISGAGARQAMLRLAGEEPAARRATLASLKGDDGRVLDQALVLWFPGPDSYTGEDVVELHLHGGPAVIDALTETLLGHGLRPAQPGEFTRRAFERGKLDLSQAEAISDLVDAETEAQRRQALAQLDGALARRHLAWRDNLMEALALLEAAVDFPDEDLPDDTAAAAAPLAAAVAHEIDQALAEGDRGERVREGYRIAIVGPPNAGKSSLLNALAGRDAAIVTATAGTTRDVIEIALNLAGFRVLVADSAGLRVARGSVEAEGVRRARALAAAADLRLVVLDASAREERWREAVGVARAGDILVLNKRDVAPPPAGAVAADGGLQHGLGVFGVSATYGAGLSELR